MDKYTVLQKLGTQYLQGDISSTALVLKAKDMLQNEPEELKQFLKNLNIENEGVTYED